MIYSARHLIRDTENAQVETAGPGSVYLCLPVLFVFAASYVEIVTDATVQVDFDEWLSRRTNYDDDDNDDEYMWSKNFAFYFFQISKSNRF